MTDTTPAVKYWDYSHYDGLYHGIGTEGSPPDGSKLVLAADYERLEQNYKDMKKALTDTEECMDRLVLENERLEREHDSLRETIVQWAWAALGLRGDYILSDVASYGDEVDRRIAWLLDTLKATLPPPMLEQDKQRLEVLERELAALRAFIKKARNFILVQTPTDDPDVANEWDALLNEAWRLLAGREEK